MHVIGYLVRLLANGQSDEVSGAVISGGSPATSPATRYDGLTSTLTTRPSHLFYLDVQYTPLPNDQASQGSSQAIARGQRRSSAGVKGHQTINPFHTVGVY